MKLTNSITTELDRRLEKAERSGFASFRYSRDQAVDTLYQQMRRELLGAVNQWFDEKTEDRKVTA